MDVEDDFFNFLSEKPTDKEQSMLDDIFKMGNDTEDIFSRLNEFLSNDINLTPNNEETYTNRFNYDASVSLLDNVGRAASFNTYYRDGQEFRSHLHGRVMDDESEHIVASLEEECYKRGNKYFVSDFIYYDTETNSWTPKREELSKIGLEKDIKADVICVDKIKVWTGPRSEHLMSIQNATNSLSGYEKRDSMNKPPKGMFLHEVVKFGDLMGTMARYKRTDNTQSSHPFSENNRTNRTNVNMARGIHEFTLLNRIMMAHNIANNPYGGSSTLISRDSENNNSLTVDSVINSVINGITFKAEACKKEKKGEKKGFSLTQMASFGTHKSVVNFNEQDLEEIANMTEEELALAPLEGAEVQVHEACFNCSAVRGSRILPDMKRKGCQLLEDTKESITSLAVNNGKAKIMKMSNSLAWNSLNTLIDMMCWEANTHKMTREEEMEFFNTEITPALNGLHVSRDNYAQASSFTQQIPKNKFLADPDIKSVSHKHKSVRTRNIFGQTNIKFKRAHRKVGELNNKKPMTGEKPPPKNKKSPKYKNNTFASQWARNMGIVRFLEFGPRVCRNRCDFREPTEEEI